MYEYKSRIQKCNIAVKSWDEINLKGYSLVLKHTVPTSWRQSYRTRMPGRGLQH